MNGDDAPCALDTELFEEGGRDDALVTDEGVGVEEGATEYADDDDGEAATENLRGIADEGAAGHGAEIGDYLGYRYAVVGEIILVRQHRGVQILRSVGLTELAGINEFTSSNELTMKLNPAIRRTMYVSNSQCRLRATLPSAINVLVRLPVACLTASRSK